MDTKAYAKFLNINLKEKTAKVTIGHSSFTRPYTVNLVFDKPYKAYVASSFKSIPFHLFIYNDHLYIYISDAKFSVPRKLRKIPSGGTNTILLDCSNAILQAISEIRKFVANNNKNDLIRKGFKKACDEYSKYADKLKSPK